jgi:hypothetical protein
VEIVDCVTRVWLCYNGLQSCDVIPALEKSRPPGIEKVGPGLECLMTCALCSGIPSTPIPGLGNGPGIAIPSTELSKKVSGGRPI